MTQVVLKKLTHRFGSVLAVDHIDLTVASGEVLALLGPSGCGKTTTMRIIAGLLDPSEGDVCFDGTSVLTLPAERRGAVLVFQKHLLFPTMSVADNIAFGLRVRGVSKSEIDRRVGEMLDLVQLPSIGKRRPHELSGGQQQRVALARALVVRPRVLLLDEPLANLDANLRIEMGELIRLVQRETRITTIFVTHDQEEAVVLADRIALMLSGRIWQVGRPRELYEEPAAMEVARFFRNPNALPGTRRGRLVETAAGPLRLERPQNDVPDGPVWVTIRPEHIEIVSGAADNVLRGRVRSSTYVGARHHISVSVCDTLWQVYGPGEVSPPPGSEVTLRLPPERVWLVRREMS